MWEIELYKSGEDTRPKRAQLSDEVDGNRFAYMQVADNIRNICIPLFMYLPSNPKACSHVIFSIHGVHRNANKYRNIFVDDLQDKNVLLVAPSFTDPFYESSLALTIGGVRNRIRESSFTPRQHWTFTHLYELFQTLKGNFPSLKTFSVFGHSAGAQFAHRLVLMTDFPELTSVVSANPGWLTFLDMDKKFPYGVADTVELNRTRAIFEKRLVFMAGSEDTYQDRYLRQSRRAMRQGANRYERVKNAYYTAQSMANDYGYVFNWELVVVDGVGHTSRPIAPLALPYLLES